MANIKLMLSTGSSTSDVVSSPNASIGGKMARTGSGGTNPEISPNSYVLGVLFDNISASENMAEVPDYRCVYIYNASGSGESPFLSTKIYVSGSSSAKFELGKVSEVNVDATVAASETSPPASIIFRESNKDSKLALGDIPVGGYYAVWIKRTPKNVGGAGTTQETLTLTIEGAQ